MVLSFLDDCIVHFDQSLRAITGKLNSSFRESPAKKTAVEHSYQELSAKEKKLSSGLMRVNHSGEVCAQALYLGQAMTAKSLTIKNELKKSAAEEVDHLFWCQTRLLELNSHVSYLNPFWFSSALLLGILAGLADDKWNLGFLAETEKQVEQHLAKHLQQLPSCDLTSLAIVEKMKTDEAQHANTAIKHGAAELPAVIKAIMQAMSKCMTTIAFYI